MGYIVVKCYHYIFYNYLITNTLYILKIKRKNKHSMLFMSKKNPHLVYTKCGFFLENCNIECLENFI